MNTEPKNRTAAEWLVIFKQINHDCRIDGGGQIVNIDTDSDNVEYYADQISNLTEGEVSMPDALKLSEEMSKLAEEEGYDPFPYELTAEDIKLLRAIAETLEVNAMEERSRAANSDSKSMADLYNKSALSISDEHMKLEELLGKLK